MNRFDERLRFPSSPLKVEYRNDNAIDILTHYLSNCFTMKSPEREIVILCIGTDRSTGDALGPLVGTKLKAGYLRKLHVYGTLEEPVHAINLADKIENIQRAHRNPVIIAIDACLGQYSSVGTINVADGPLKPGAGVKKELPSVGDLHITGIVNVGGFMEYFVLQNTRLYLVMRMAEIIASSLLQVDNSLSKSEMKINSLSPE